METEAIKTGIRKKDPRVIAKLITLAENFPDKAAKILAKFSGDNSKSIVIGITGSPGAGKSTLTDKLALALSVNNKKVAILAVDPSSPFTMGAVLGDRFRMTAAARKKIFIRSFASRGSLGGLADVIPNAISILQAAGYDYIIIETVGVGQGEVDIAAVADCAVVVLVPGMGDTLQTMKAGILEIADLFVINKADHAGTEILERELLNMLEISSKTKPFIGRVIATKGNGIKELAKEIVKFTDTQQKSGKFNARREKFYQFKILNRLQQLYLSSPKLQEMATKHAKLCLTGKSNTESSVKKIFKAK